MHSMYNLPLLECIRNLIGFAGTILTIKDPNDHMSNARKALHNGDVERAQRREKWAQEEAKKGGFTIDKLSDEEWKAGRG